MILFSVLNHVFYHWTQILRSLSSTFYLYLPVSQNRPQSSCHILEPYLSNMLKFIKDNLKFLNISNSDFNVIYKYIFNIIDTKHSSFINITINEGATFRILPTLTIWLTTVLEHPHTLNIKEKIKSLSKTERAGKSHFQMSEVHFYSRKSTFYMSRVLHLKFPCSTFTVHSKW